MHCQTWARVITIAATCVLLAATSCKKKTQPATPAATKAPAFFAPPADTRDQLLGTIVLPSMSGTIDKVASIAKQLQLPVTPEQIRGWVQNPLPLPQEVWTHLDATQPVAVAMTAGRENVPPPTAIAARAKSAKDAQALVSALGQKLGSQDGAIHLKRPDDAELWLYVNDQDIVASESFDALKVAGGHALAARSKISEDVLATVYPAAMAKAEGTTVRQALDKFRAQFLNVLQQPEAGAASPLPPDVTAKMMNAFLDPYLDQLADIKAADIGLVVDSKQGLLLRGRAHPAEGSAFAKSLANVQPAKLAPPFAADPIAPGLFAVNYGRETIKRYAEAMDSLAQIEMPGMKAFAGGMKDMMLALEGSYSGSFAFNNGMNYSFVAELAKGTDPEALMGALDSALGPQGLGLLINSAMAAETGRKGRSKSAGKRAKGSPMITWKRQGLVGHLEIPLTPTQMPAKEAKQMQQIFGGSRIKYTFVVTDNKLLGLVNAKPEAEIARLSSPAAAATGPQVQQVLDETAGSEGFVYMDLLGLVRPLIEAGAKADPSMAQANAMMGMMPALQQMSVPMIFSYRGGEAATINWSVPLRAFETLATALRPMFGMMGAMAAPGAAPPANPDDEGM